MQYDDVVHALSLPETYPEHPARIEHVETHISRVFLTEDFVYKLKKPVQFGFLDFSSLVARQRACEDEVRLNRRLAPEVYLGVVPVAVGVGGSLAVDGVGTVVDWLVKMRRLPADRAMDRLILAGQLAAEDVARLSEALVRFYAAAERIPTPPAQYSAAIADHVRANARDLSEGKDPRLARLAARATAAQLRFLSIHRHVVERRASDGRIVEGHGDLRPEHVYFVPHPVVIDCVEFSRELRSVDVADDLAFLAMECQRLKADWVGRQVLGEYARQSGDQPPAALMALYQSYRACVRAKVASLRAGQETLAEEVSGELNLEQSYLELAARAAEGLGPPLLLVVRGLSGTGKSTLAEALAAKLQLTWLQTDRIRRELFGDVRAAAVDEGHYAPRRRHRVYEAMFQRAESALVEGTSVVLDGTFAEAEQLAAAADTASRHRAALLVLDCRCPEETALARLARRTAEGTSRSDAGAEVYRRQQAGFAACPAGVPSIDIDTTQDVESQAAAVTDRLRSLAAAPAG